MKKGKIYKGQTKLTLRLHTNQDLTGATPLVKYEKPDETTGQFTPLVSDPTSGIIEWIPSSPNDLDQAGEWKFWADVTFADSRVAVGEVAEITVHEPGT